MVDNCLEYNSTSDADQSITEDQRKEAKWYCVYGNEFRRKWKEAVYPTLKFLTMNKESHVAGMGVSKQHNKQTSTLQAATASNRKQFRTAVSAARPSKRSRSPVKKEKAPDDRKRIRSNSSTTIKVPLKRINTGPHCGILDTPGRTRTSSTSPNKLECNSISRTALGPPKVRLQHKLWTMMSEYSPDYFLHSYLWLPLSLLIEFYPLKSQVMFQLRM